MQALQEAEFKGITLSAPFPDVVNHVLGCLDLAPLCGIGNLDEIAPKVRWLAANKMNVKIDEIEVFLVAHHALEGHVYGHSETDPPPFFLRIEHQGKDVTEEVEAKELLFTPFPLPPGNAIHFLTAGSTIRLIRALTGKDRQLLHVPGPNGLPGGYPVCVGEGRIEIADIRGITLKEAVRINEQSHRYDGIERIENDGTIVFSSKSLEIFQEELGYGASHMPPFAAREYAVELITRFREYAGKFGVHF
jgi:hypothetical protein